MTQENKSRLIKFLWNLASAVLAAIGTALGGIVGGLGGAALTSSSLMLSGIAGGAAGSYVNTSMTQIMNKDVNLGALYTQTIAGGIMGALGTKGFSKGIMLTKMVVSCGALTIFIVLWGNKCRVCNNSYKMYL